MSIIKPLEGGKHVKLSDFDPGHHNGLDREDAEAQSAKLLVELGELQELLYASQETSVLIVLQGLDSAGKDGTIDHIFRGLNPQSCHVASFKVPTPLECNHDFLWRIHAAAPQKGTIKIFNRSHYEDVLVVRVHNIVPEKIWRKRYDEINAFERLLTDNGTIILKFFLHISKDEQKERLLQREADPAKSWKLSVQDWKERELWDQYQAAYEDVLNICSKPHAPWIVTPANHKWFRNLAVAEAIVESLRPYRNEWEKRLNAIGQKEKELLAQMRQQK